MKKILIRSRLLILVSIVCVFAVSCGQDQPVDFPILSGPYFGQTPPGETPEKFAPGIVSTELEEVGTVFSPDGTEMLFSREIDGEDLIHISELKNGVWTKSLIASFSTGDYDLDYCYSPDGNRIYFCSKRITSATMGGLDIWFTDRTESGWSEPQNAGPPINNVIGSSYPSVTNNNRLYFEAPVEGLEGRGIYYSQIVDGKFTERVKLNSPVNTLYSEGDTFVDPDERYLITGTMARPNSYGRGDLYIRYRLENGEWTEAINMGPTINNEMTQNIPCVTSDGKYLFFTSNGEVYWVSSKIIEDLKPDEIK